MAFTPFVDADLPTMWFGQNGGQANQANQSGATYKYFAIG